MRRSVISIGRPNRVSSFFIVKMLIEQVKRGCKKSCVYGEIIFPDMSQICRNLLSNIATFMLSNFFSDNSIANPLHPIHVF